MSCPYCDYYHDSESLEIENLSYDIYLKIKQDRIDKNRKKLFEEENRIKELIDKSLKEYKEVMKINFDNYINDKLIKIQFGISQTLKIIEDKLDNLSRSNNE